MTKAIRPNSVPFDPHTAQASRVADFLEPLPEGATAPEINAACDTGCVRKVISVMRNDLGYIIKLDWRWVLCVGGTKRRKRRVYILVSRPTNAQQTLFPST